MILRVQILQWVKENNTSAIHRLYEENQFDSDQKITVTNDYCEGHGEETTLTLKFEFPGEGDLLVTLAGTYNSYDDTSWNEVFVSEPYTVTETRYRQVVQTDPYEHTETRYRKAQ